MVLFAVIVLMFLSQLRYKVLASKCSMDDPVPIFHKSFQSGDFIVAGVMSQIYIFSDRITFRSHPSQKLFDEIQ